MSTVGSGGRWQGCTAALYRIRDFPQRDWVPTRVYDGGRGVGGCNDCDCDLNSRIECVS